MGSSVYRLAAGASLHSTGTGLLIPVFARSDRNALFVHIADRDNKIVEFVPYYDFDEYVTHAVSNALLVDIGYPAPITFLVSDEVVCLRSSAELASWFELNHLKLSSFDLLRSQLRRLSGSSLGHLYLDLEKAAKRIFGVTKNAKNWVEGEAMIYQRSNAIWDMLDARVPIRPSRALTPDFNMPNFSPEELIEYILNPERYDDEGWEWIWEDCEAVHGLDNVIFDAGYSWISYIFATYRDEAYQHVGVLSRLIQYQYVSFVRHKPFIDFLAELFCEGLADAVEANFPFLYHRMAIELAQDEMSVDEQLEFLAASFFFFNEATEKRMFFAKRLVSLLVSVKPDSFSRGNEDVPDILETLARTKEIDPQTIASLKRKFRIDW